MKLLTEDERFREYLMGFDEYKLCEEAKEYIPTAVKRQSLISVSYTHLTLPTTPYV